MLLVWRLMDARSCGVSPSPNNCKKTFRGLYSIGRGDSASRKDSVVYGAAAARRHLNGGFRGDFQRGQRSVLADDLRDHLIESRGHVRARTARVRTSGAEPRRRIEGMHRARAGGVLQIPERGNVLLVRLEGGENRAELEIGAGTARRPVIHGRAMRRVVHDRAVGNVEEAARSLGTAAVCARAVEAGTMASRNGNASVTPAAFSTVLRERCFLVMNMILLL